MTGGEDNPSPERRPPVDGRLIEVARVLKHKGGWTIRRSDVIRPPDWPRAEYAEEIVPHAVTDVMMARGAL